MVEDCSRPSWNGCHVCVAKPGSRLDQSIEDGFEIESRSTDDFEHIGGGGLLLEGFAQLIEQPRVLDGDDRLCGKVLVAVRSVCR